MIECRTVGHRLGNWYLSCERAHPSANPKETRMRAQPVAASQNRRIVAGLPFVEALARRMIAPTCAIASVRIVGGITGRPPAPYDRYFSLNETFLMPTIRLSTSNSVIRSTSKKGYRWGRMRSMAA